MSSVLASDSCARDRAKFDARGHAASAFCAQKDEEFAGFPTVEEWCGAGIRRADQRGSHFSGIQRQCEVLAQADAHEANRLLHVGFGRVGHYIGAPVRAQALYQRKRIIWLAVDVDDDHVVSLRQHLGKFFNLGRERRELLELGARTPGERAGHDSSALFVGTEERDR